MTPAACQHALCWPCATSMHMVSSHAATVLAEPPAASCGQAFGQQYPEHTFEATYIASYKGRGSV